MDLSKKEKIDLFVKLKRARAYDLMFASRLRRGKLMAFYHQSEGGEAPGVGVCSMLNKDDYLWPHYRGHGVPHIIGKNADPKYYLAEHCTKATGVAKGVSAIHPVYEDYKIFGWTGSVGGGFPFVVGYGLAAKNQNKKQIAMYAFGDGATNRGVMHESMIMSVQWNLPNLWVCENNRISMFVPLKDVYKKVDNIVDLAKGYGMKTHIVDGQNVFEVARVAKNSIKDIRSGKGPVFIECKTERYHEHDIGTPDLWEDQHRTKEDIEKLRERDPIKIATEIIKGEKIVDDEFIEKLDKEIKEEVDNAEKFTDESPNPKPEVLEGNLYA